MVIFFRVMGVVMALIALFGIMLTLAGADWPTSNCVTPAVLAALAFYGSTVIKKNKVERNLKNGEPLN